MALDIEKIYAGLISEHQVVIHHFESLDSTNRWLFDRLDEKNIHAHVCIADTQTAGRGRGGKHWMATTGDNILMSVAYSFEKPVEDLSLLGLVTGIAVADVLVNRGISGISLKWPNDVYLNGAKLAGILIQTRISATGRYNLVAGIGLNVYLDDADKAAIGQPVADLSDAGYGPGHRETLVYLLINQLFNTYGLFMIRGWEYLRERWDELDYFRGRRVFVKQGDICYEGDYLGITESGAMRLRMTNGQLREFYAGDVSLRSFCGHSTNQLF